MKDIENKLIENKSLLNEYSNKVINDMVNKFQKEMKNTLSKDDIIRKINRFKEIAKPEALLKKIKNGDIVMPPTFTEPNPKTGKMLNPLDIYIVIPGKI